MKKPAPSIAALLQSVAQSLPLLILVACGGNGSSSSSSTSSTSASTVPGAPTLSSASGGNATATLSFVAPTSTGGQAITSYTAACTSGTSSISTSGSASPVTVGGLANDTTYSCSVAAVNSIGTGASSNALSVTPSAASSSSGSGADLTALPVGDTMMLSTAPTSSQQGYLYLCKDTKGVGPGNTTKGPWFNADGTTWNSVTKESYLVQGTVAWTSSFLSSLGSTLNLSGNGLPNHTTGTFPITAATSPAAYTYDQNGISIQSVTIAWGLPANPTVNSTPTCIAGGAIGVFLTGARLYGAMDAKSRDAHAWEVGDMCEGHPGPGGAYHYHSLPACGLASDVSGQHSALIGYVADGFGLYGNQGEGGAALKNSDLDECHGHTHAITVNGATVTQYHYHTTPEFPYAVGCYRGTPVSTQ